VRPGPDGKPIVELDGDDYPSREVYYDDGRQGRTYEAIPSRPPTRHPNRPPAPHSRPRHD